MKTLFRPLYLFLILSISLLSSCGGGGSGSGGDNTPSAPTTAQGKFIDAAVEGITYTSGSSTGTTSTDGSFTYETGQSVTFSIGGITLGTVSGSPIITPVQLISGASNQTNSSVTNIVQFLLSIDDDNDASNGIKITPAMSTAAAGLTIDFTSATFDTDGDVSSAIAAIKAFASIGSIGLVSSSVAQAHLSGSLFSILAGSYSGRYTGTDSGTWTVNIATNGKVTGSGITNFDGSSFNINGSVNTSGTVSVSAVGSAGSSSWSGTILITAGTLSGSWKGLADNGTFSGSKQ